MLFLHGPYWVGGVPFHPLPYIIKSSLCGQPCESVLILDLKCVPLAGNKPTQRDSVHRKFALTPV